MKGVTCQLRTRFLETPCRTGPDRYPLEKLSVQFARRTLPYFPASCRSFPLGENSGGPRQVRLPDRLLTISCISCSFGVNEARSPLRVAKWRKRVEFREFHFRVLSASRGPPSPFDVCARTIQTAILVRESREHIRIT